MQLNSNLNEQVALNKNSKFKQASSSLTSQHLLHKTKSTVVILILKKQTPKDRYFNNQLLVSFQSMSLK